MNVYDFYNFKSIKGLQGKRRERACWVKSPHVAPPGLGWGAVVGRARGEITCGGKGWPQSLSRVKQGLAGSPDGCTVNGTEASSPFTRPGGCRDVYRLAGDRWKVVGLSLPRTFQLQEHQS